MYDLRAQTTVTHVWSAILVGIKTALLWLAESVPSLERKLSACTKLGAWARDLKNYSVAAPDRLLCRAVKLGA